MHISNATGNSDCRAGVTNKLCNFAHAPFSDCYCTNLKSSNIARIAKFCMSDYESCQIYIRMIKYAK